LLAELDDWLFKADKKPDPTPSTTLGLGRNCTIFDQLRQVAYREVRSFKRQHLSPDQFLNQLLQLALTLNSQFLMPLSYAEIRGISKSVAKWTWKHFSEERFCARQRAVISIRWKGHISAEETKPWEEDGVSRATWFRRKSGLIVPS